MDFYLAWQNLKLRKARTVISVLAVAVGIMTLLVVRGMAVGTVGEVAHRMQTIEGDLLVYESRASIMMMNHGMDLKYADLIGEIPSVSRVVPVLHTSVSMLKQDQKVFAVYLDDFKLFSGQKKIIEGRMFSNNPDENEILIDSKLSRDGGYRVGQEVKDGPRLLKIVGIIEQGVAGRVFMSYETARRLWFNDRDIASMMVVKVEDPEQIGAVQEGIREIGLEALQKDDYYSAIMAAARYLEYFIYGVTAVALLASLLTVLLTMFTLVQEQTRDVGILKSLGAGKSYIMRLVMGQSLLICAGGIVTGIGFSFAARFVILSFWPLLSVDLSAQMLLLATVIGLSGAMLGALYPGWRAARLDPVETLIYE